MSSALETYGPIALNYALRLLGVVVLLVVAHLLARWANRRLHAVLTRAKLDVTLAKFLATLARWAILSLAVIAALGVFGIQTASFAVVLGAVGLAVGLGFQGALSNFAAGVVLLVFRPFKVGDVVTISGVTGKVDEIGLISTSVDTPDNRRVILPNGPILGATIENITFHAKRRVEVAVGSDYEADLDAVRAALAAAAETVSRRLPDQPVDVVLLELGASSINWSVRVWAKSSDFLAAKQELTRAVKRALDAERISIPFPQMHVHVRPAPPSAAQRAPSTPRA